MREIIGNGGAKNCKAAEWRKPFCGADILEFETTPYVEDSQAGEVLSSLQS